MELLVLLFLVPAGLKIVTMVNAMRWLEGHGADYRADLVAAERGSRLPLAEPARLELFRRHDAEFFPFGFKDVRLRGYVQSASPNLAGKLARRLSALFGATLYRLHRLTAMASLFAIAASYAESSGHGPTLVRGSLFQWTLLLLTWLLVICCVVQGVEAVYSYAILGGYAAPFHWLSATSISRGKALLRELRVLVGSLINTVTAAAGAVFVAGSGLGLFQGVPRARSSSDLPGFAVRVVDSVYFVSTTLWTVGYGDVRPTRPAAKLLVVSIQAAGFALLGLALVALGLAIAGDLDTRSEGAA